MRNAGRYLLLCALVLRAGASEAPESRGTQPAGACCNPDNTCSDNVVEAACESAGGVYRGDGSICAAVSCGGACCFGDATCAITSRANCLQSYGSYLDGGVCADLEPCPICFPEDPENRDLLDGPNEACIIGSNVNPGCGTGAPNPTYFSPVECNQTICAGAAFDGGSRDLDWYQVSVAQETEMLIRLENGLLEDARLLFRFRYYPNQQIPPAGSGDGTPCSTVGALEVIPAVRGNSIPPGITVFPIVVPAGVYTILVAYDFNTPGSIQPVCPNNYRLTIDCASASCAFACEAGAVDVENEAGCGSPTDINSGCADASSPQAFTPLAVGQIACGSSRLIQTTGPTGVNAVRDRDWYSIDLPSGDWRVRFQAEFHSVLALRPIGALQSPNCLNADLFSLIVPQCEEAVIDLENLAGGAYAIVVMPDFGAYAWFLGSSASAPQELCPAPYQLLVAPPPGCNSPCADANCDGFVTVGDIGFFVDAIVAGEPGWTNRFLPGLPTCAFLCANDTNRDGFVTVGDIGSFVAAVSAGAACP